MHAQTRLLWKLLSYSGPRLRRCLINVCGLFAADPDDPLKTTDQTRQLGLIVCFLLISCVDFSLMRRGRGRREERGL